MDKGNECPMIVFPGSYIELTHHWGWFPMPELGLVYDSLDYLPHSLLNADITVKTEAC